MNKKGFTLIELLATIVVFGIISIFAITSITDSISSSKDESVVNLGKNYAEAARLMRAQDLLYYVPKKDEAVIIPYSEIIGTEISNKDKTAYGEIFPSYSYIGILNNNNNFSYYITQVDESYHLLNKVEYNSANRNDVISSEDAYNDITEIKAPFTNFNISYGNNTYNIKGLRVEYSAKYVQESNKLRTAFDLSDRKIKFKGEIILYNWTTNNSNRKIELNIENNQLNYLDNKVYTLKKATDGYTGIWTAVNSDNTTLKVNGKELKVNIQMVDNGKIFFDFILGDSTLYSGITSSEDVLLSGYYTPDSSYILSNAQIKGVINTYDYFVQTGNLSGTTNNVVTIKSVNYRVNSSKVKCIIVKK